MSSASSTISSTTNSDELPQDIVNLISDIRNTTKNTAEIELPTPATTVSMQVADTTVTSPRNTSSRGTDYADHLSSVYSTDHTSTSSKKSSLQSSPNISKNRDNKKFKDLSFDIPSVGGKHFAVIFIITRYTH